MTKVMSKAREKAALKNLRQVLGANFAAPAQERNVGVAGEGLVSINGQLFPSNAEYGAGTATVVNKGRLASAMYAAGDGAGSAVVRASGVSTGGGGGGGTVTAHALSDTTIHTGTLLWSLLNLSGSALADLASRPHSALTGIGADDHHNHATGGTDISVNGSQVVSLNNHDILSRHTVSGGAANDIIGQSGAGVLARLTPASDVSAGIERILKSNSSGFVRLKSAEVAGQFDVTNNGQIYVAGGVGGSSGIIKSAGSTPDTARVGFGRDADPQFTVDVNGALRADYLVGKHAIQLDHALLLTHFDGDPRSYVGEYNGLNGRIGTSTGTVFLPAKFGKGVARPNATTNYAYNPSFEANVFGASPSSWTTIQSGSGATWAIANAISHTGAVSLQIGGSSTGSALVRNNNPISVANGARAYGSIWVYRTEAWAGQVILANLGGTSLASTAFDVSVNAVLNDWVEYSVEWLNSTGSAVDVYLRVSNGAAANDRYIWIDSAMLCAQATAGDLHPYFDGNCPNAAWSGTVNASTSTITPSYVQYTSQGNIDAYSGTVMFWVKPYQSLNARWFQMQSTLDSDLYFQLGTNGSGTIFGRAGSSTIGTNIVSSGVTAVAGQEYHIALTYMPTLVTIYVNGEAKGSYVPGKPYAAGATDVLRVLNTGAALIDDFVTTADVLNPKLIRSIYESDAPVFAESSVFTFRATVNGLFNADENGLWGRNALGQAMFGMYGGLSSLTWGGVTLNTGDLLIGRDPNYVMWDDSAAAMIFSAGSVPGTALANGAVTTVKIAAGAVTSNELGSGAVTSTKIGTGAVTTNAIDAAAVTNAKLAANAVAGSNIQNTTITGNKIATGEIVANHLNITDVAAISTLYTGAIVVGSTDKLWLNTNSSGGTTGTLLGDLAIGGSTKASAPFRVSAAGAITAISGTMGGWSLASGEIGSGSGVGRVGLIANTGTAHATVMYAGSGTVASAPFRVTSFGHAHVRNLVASVSGSPIDVYDYSDGIVTGSLIASFLRPSGSSSGIEIGATGNKVRLSRTDGTNGAAFLSNYGTGNIEVYIGATPSRSAVFQSNGDFSTYDTSGNALGRITSTGVIRSRRQISTGGTTLYATDIAAEVQTNIANNGSSTLDSSLAGVMVITENSNETALVILKGSAATPIIVSQTATNRFSTVAGNSGTINICISGGDLVIQNRYGFSRNVSITVITHFTF